MIRPVALLWSVLALAACDAPAADQADGPPTPTPVDGPVAAMVDDTVEPLAIAADAADGFLAKRFADELADGGVVNVISAATDLNADGKAEIVAYVSGPALCGSGGCNVLVLQPDGDSFTVRMDASVSKLPVTVLSSSTNGWRDLTVWVGGGGGESGNAVLRFDGAIYPSNPTVPPAELTEEEGTVLIAQDAWENMRKLSAE